MPPWFQDFMPTDGPLFLCLAVATIVFFFIALSALRLGKHTIEFRVGKLVVFHIYPRTVHSDQLALIKEAVCRNQAAYLEYSHYARELHKSLRIALSSGTTIDMRGKLFELDTYLDTHLKQAVFMNFELLTKLFMLSHKSGEPPRICTKSSLPDIKHGLHGSIWDKHGARISDQFRYHSPAYINAPFKLEENTGFHRVSATGKHFIANDIPVASRSGDYLNPRLVREKVLSSYKRPLRDVLPMLHHIIPAGRDRKWEHCWLPYTTPKRTYTPPEASYKSTLIIPITLWNNKLDGAFVALMERKLRIQTFQRCIFAFLCFDHKDCNYFDVSSDASIGYVFADMISLYMLEVLALTHMSSVYRECQTTITKDTL